MNNNLEMMEKGRETACFQVMSHLFVQLAIPQRYADKNQSYPGPTEGNAGLAQTITWKEMCSSLDLWLI